MRQPITRYCCLLGLLLIAVACSGPDANSPTEPPAPTPTVATAPPTSTVTSEPTTISPSATPSQPAPTETAAPTATPTVTPTATPPPGGYNPNIGSRAEDYVYPAVVAQFPDGLDYQIASHNMAQRSWQPGDPSLFLGTETVPSAAGPSPSEEQQTAQLRAFLEKRFPNQPERVDGALALLSDDRMLAKVTDHRLRVALVALSGTIAEPAIERFLSDFLLLEFADLAGQWNGESNTVVDGSGVPRQQVRISNRHQHEHFALLSVVLSHELMHDDGSISRDEERIAPMIQQLVHMQQMLIDPEIVQTGTWFARYYNTLTLARLNPAFENRLTLFERGGAPFNGSFMDYLDGYLLDQDLPESSNPSPLLSDILLALAERDSDVPIDPAFDDASIDFIERNHAPLGPVELVTVGCILQLEIPICANSPTDQPAGIAAAVLFDIDGEPLRYLSTDEHPYFDGNTLVDAGIVVTGNPSESITAIALEVLEDGIVIATGELISEASWPAFGNDRTLRLGTDSLRFAIPSSQFAGIDRTTDSTLAMRIRATTSTGAELTYDAGEVGKLVLYRGENRYEDRDEARGGDDWLTPSALAVLEYFGDAVVIGDISDMNGGPFPPHVTHQAGVDIDAWFWGYNELDAATAETLIGHLNDPVYGSWIELVYVTYEQNDSDPLWLAIRDVTLDDGRLARDVIQPYPDHDTHFHWRIVPTE